MDSRSIAEALDALQPEPSLHMRDQSDLIDRTMAALGAVFAHLRPLALPRVPTDLLSKESARYFFDTRHEMFGMSLPDLAVTDDAQHAVRNAKPALDDLKKMMLESKTSEGPFVMGGEVSFADFVLAGAWSFLRDLDRQGDLYDKVVGHDAVFLEQWKACQPWLERKD